jgi:hypothetical protein
VFPCLGLYPETAQPGSRKDSHVVLCCRTHPSCYWLSDFYNGRRQTARLRGRPSHSQLFILRYELGISPLLAQRHQAVTHVIAVQARLVGIILLRRLRSPMPQLDHVLDLYPETAGRSSREGFAFKNTARCFGLFYKRWPCCASHLTFQPLWIRRTVQIKKATGIRPVAFLLTMLYIMTPA